MHSILRLPVYRASPNEYPSYTPAEIRKVDGGKLLPVMTAVGKAAAVQPR